MLKLPLCAALLVAASAVSSQTALDMTKPSYTVFHEMGKVEEASFDNTLPLENQWVHRSGAWVNLKGQRGDRLSLDLVIGGVYYSNTKEQTDANTKTRFFAASVPRFDVTYKFGDVEDPFLKLNAGIFNYKYNEYSRNLGEYAFRSGTYPGWISTGGITYVGVNSAQVTGFRFSQNLGPNFTHELLATLETEVLPTYDMSLTYMAKYNWQNVVKVGGGVQLARILPAVPSRTNPGLLRDPTSGAVNPNVSNRYFKHNGEWYIDWADYYDALMAHPGTTGADSARYTRAKAVLDSARGRDISGNPLDGGAGNPLINVDYENYNASGVKPIATFAFDPKPLVGGVSMLGPNDLVVYGEAALLGVKDYPIFYDDWTKRVPVMVGFNFPTFKMLDVLSLEVEYYGSEYPDNFQGIISGQVQGTPWPTIPSSYDASDWESDNWKWSVYAQRKVVDGVTLSAQVARDHARAWAYPTGKTYWGIMNDDNDWYWMLKLTANL
jgi:hypothetical protein